MRLVLSGPRLRLDWEDPALHLTTAQKQALATDREIVVSAGAGAGKTHTLALRYVALLIELAEDALAAGGGGVPRPDIESVLVLTFTEKAAEEMTERCYQRLLDLVGSLRRHAAELGAARGEAAARALLAAFDHLVDSFPLARISTFHGFCARLLREFPSESRTHPAFEVLPQPQADRLRAEATEGAFLELAREDAESLGLLLDAFGGSRRRVEEALGRILEHRAALLPRLEAWAREEVGVEALLDAAEIRPARVEGWLRGVGLPTLEQVWELLRACQDAELWAVEVLPPLVARLRALPEDPLELNELYQRALRALLRADGKTVRTFTAPSDIGAAKHWPSRERFEAAKEALSGLGQACAQWAALHQEALRLPTRADRALLDVLRALSRAALRAVRRLESALEERRALDFASLQARAAQAVGSQPALLAQLRRRFRYLMVDEFQDTDQVQWGLVHALGRPDGTPDDRIFLVGDTKQAIYGFRGGDVTVFRAAVEALGVPPLEFPENFRSGATLIEWYNAVFHRVLGSPDTPGPPWEARYSPLRPGRGEQTGGTVTLLQTTGTGASGAQQEAEATARWLLTELLPGSGDYAGLELLDRERHPRPPVAVLLRARTHLAAWEAALQRHGLPYLVAGGVGFWARPEVVDLVNALDAIATGDRGSLVGWLRSPLVGLCDQDIQDLHDWGALDHLHWRELPPEAGPAVRAAQALYTALVRLRDRLPAEGLLGEVLDRCRAWHLYGLGADGGQAEGNARRLVRMVRELDGEGSEGVEAIARLLVRQVQENTRESEASIPPAAARVVLMTVHASKGLEFPVVVVPGLGERPSTPPEDLLLHRLDGRWELACKVPDPAADVQRRASPGLLHRVQEQRRLEEQAESRRLLYVAVTRAERHLVLVGNPEAGKEGNSRSWLDLIKLHHGSPILPDRLLRVVEAEALLDRPLPRPAPPPALAPPGPEATRRAAPVPARYELEVSPSGLDLFLDCPARWYRRELMRVSEHVQRRQLRDEALAAARGEVIHSLLEDDLADDEEVARQRWEARAHAEGCTADEVDALLPRLLEHLRLSAADPWLRAVLAAPGWPEVPFRVPYGDLTLRGKIDRVWRDPASGRWSVLDYKSESLSGPLRQAAARHRVQLLCYAWAASRVLGQGQPLPEIGAQVYFTERATPVELGPLGPAELGELERVLDELRTVATQSWAEVEADAIRTPRRCSECGFHRHGCKGSGAGGAEG